MKRYVVLFLCLAVSCTGCFASLETAPSLSEQESSSESSVAEAVPIFEVPSVERTLDEIRLSIPYSGMTDTAPVGSYPVMDDETSVRLADFIYSCWGEIGGAPPELGFLAPADAPRAFVLQASLNNTNQITEAHPDMEMLMMTYAQKDGWIQEHVEQTAKTLFGDQYQMEHDRWSMKEIRYYAGEGVYVLKSPPKQKVLPFVTALREEPGRYVVSVAAVPLTLSDTGEWELLGENGEEIQPDALGDYCLAQPQHTITLAEDPDGTLCYYAHRLPHTARPVVLWDPELLTVYTRSEDSDLFAAQPVALSQEITHEEIIAHAAQQLDVELEIASIAFVDRTANGAGETIHYYTTTVNLAGSLTEQYTKEQVASALDSLDQTFSRNSNYIYYSTDFLVGGMEYQYDCAPFRLVEDTQEQYAAVRALVPYERGDSDPTDTFYYAEGITLEQLETYLQALMIDNPIASLEELTNDQVLDAALSITPAYYPTWEYKRFALEKDWPLIEKYYRPELMPLVGPTEEHRLKIKEHVEENIRLLFGDIPFTHENTYWIDYWDTVGVYTVPHRGIPGIHKAAALDFTQSGDVVTVEVVYYFYGLDADYYHLSREEPVSEEELANFLQNEAPRLIATFREQADGVLRLESQQPKE